MLRKPDNCAHDDTLPSRAPTYDSLSPCRIGIQPHGECGEYAGAQGTRYRGCRKGAVNSENGTSGYTDAAGVSSAEPIECHSARAVSREHATNATQAAGSPSKNAIATLAPARSTCALWKVTGAIIASCRSGPGSRQGQGQPSRKPDNSHSDQPHHEGSGTSFHPALGIRQCGHPER